MPCCRWSSGSGCCSPRPACPGCPRACSPTSSPRTPTVTPPAGWPEGLRVSPAAISGAVRYLVRAGLLDKGREPGSRSDHYRIYDDVWSAIALQRIPLLQRWEGVMAEAAQRLPGGSRGRRRLRETQAYYRFIATESPRLIERWKEQKGPMVDELEDDST